MPIIPLRAYRHGLEAVLLSAVSVFTAPRLPVEPLAPIDTHFTPLTPAMNEEEIESILYIGREVSGQPGVI